MVWRKQRTQTKFDGRKTLVETYFAFFYVATKMTN